MDTSILLRNQLTRVGTEMWVKVYSPTVVGIEVVQRAEKRARRARLYYMRYVLQIRTWDETSGYIHVNSNIQKPKLTRYLQQET